MFGRKKFVVLPVVLTEEDEVVLKEQIAQARSHSDKCSTCAAFVMFYDKGTFTIDGMTLAGVKAHLLTSHKST